MPELRAFISVRLYQLLNANRRRSCLALRLPEDLPPKTLVPAVSNTGELRGDWVLFHPVYTPEELRSVEVRDLLCSPSLYIPGSDILSRWATRFCSEMRRHSPTESHIRLSGLPGKCAQTLLGLILGWSLNSIYCTQVGFRLCFGLQA